MPTTHFQNTHRAEASCFAPLDTPLTRSAS